MLRDIFEDNNLGLTSELCRAEANSSDFGDGIAYSTESIAVGIPSKARTSSISSASNKHHLSFYHKAKIFRLILNDMLMQSNSLE